MTARGWMARVPGQRRTPFFLALLALGLTEHYWGYTRQRDGGTLEYQVEHPRWTVWTATHSAFFGPGSELYGPDFGQVLASPPNSAFVAVGSPVAVHKGVRLAD